MASFAQFGNQLYSGERSIDFIAKRRIWYLTALGLMALSVVALIWRGLTPGIEFSGGSEFKVSQVSDTSGLKGQQAVTSVAPNTEVRTSVLGDDSIRVQTEQLSDTQTDQVRASLAKAYDVSEDNITSSFVGPVWGQDVTQKAVQGLLVFLVLVALVISVYFRTWKMAAAALVALLHDLVITVGVYSAVGFEVTPASVIGLLTILGYSLYDTVVVFDKVRENTEHITTTTKRTFGEAANLAVNQTLVRSINTSVVALLPVAAILFIGALLLGAGTLKDLSLALLVGMAAGTYSSIGIATPILYDLRRREPDLLAQAQRVQRRRREEATRSAVPVGARGAAAGEGDDPRDSAGPAGQGGDEPELAPAGTAPAALAPPRQSPPGQPRQGQPRQGQQGQRQQPRRGGGGRNRQHGKRR